MAPTSPTSASETPCSATCSGSLEDSPVHCDRGARGAQAETEACRDCAVPVEVRVLPAAPTRHLCKSYTVSRAAVAQLAEADRDQSQTIAPDSAFATDRRIDRTQAPGVEMPVQVRPAQLDVRWSKGRTRRHNTDLSSQACRCATWVASQGSEAGYASEPAPVCGLRARSRSRLWPPSPLPFACRWIRRPGSFWKTYTGPAPDCVHKERGQYDNRHIRETCRPHTLQEPDLP